MMDNGFHHKRREWMFRKNQQGPAQDNDSGPLFIVGAIVLLFVVVWWRWHASIAGAVLWLRWVELSAIEFFVSIFDEHSAAAAAIAWINAFDNLSGQVKFTDVLRISAVPGLYLRWVSLATGLGLAIWLLATDKKNQFSHRYTVDEFASTQEDVWPSIKFALRFNLSETDIDKGKWASVATEKQFIIRHKLRRSDGTLDREKAEAAFAAQLGNLWVGYSGLPAHSRALFACFAARIAGEKDGKLISENMLDKFAHGAAAGSLPISGCDEIAKRYLNNSKIVEICSRHAYEYCVLASMLEAAQDVLPLPPNRYLWLKVVDRRLLYTLHNIGMMVPTVENAGVFAHRAVEKALGRALEMPVLRKAVDGLETAMAGYIWTDDEFETLTDNDMGAEAVRDIGDNGVSSSVEQGKTMQSQSRAATEKELNSLRSEQERALAAQTAGKTVEEFLENEALREQSGL